jgi:hypothetical protein
MNPLKFLKPELPRNFGLWKPLQAGTVSNQPDSETGLSYNGKTQTARAVRKTATNFSLADQKRNCRPFIERHGKTWKSMDRRDKNMSNYGCFEVFSEIKRIRITKRCKLKIKDE